MKVKRIVARDMRTALAEFRDRLGPDAVVLSNRRLSQGVELVGATGVPASSGSRSRRAPAGDAGAAEPGPRRRVGATGSDAKGPSDLHELRAELRREMAGLRSALESRVDELVWGQHAARRRSHAGLWGWLSELGLATDLCEVLTGHCSPATNARTARSRALAALEAMLPVAGDRIIEDGGVVALVGPTGVGKTTTIAKLAARHMITHGPGSLALLSTDQRRVGAQEQLRAFARILGVPHIHCTPGQEPRRLLEELRGKRLMLVDTAGIGQRDAKLPAHLDALRAVGEQVRSYLVLPATADLCTLDQVAVAFRDAPLSGSIITKVDESARLGNALSVVIRHELPVAYLGVGQSVPEHLELASARRLVQRLDDMLAEWTAGPLQAETTLGEGVRQPTEEAG